MLGEPALEKPFIEAAGVLRKLGDWEAVNGRWRQAVERFSRLVQVDQLDGWDVVTLDYLELGPSLIELGDLTGYERFRTAILQRFAGTSYPVSDRIIKVALLLPAEQKTLRELSPHAQVAEKSF